MFIIRNSLRNSFCKVKKLNISSLRSCSTKCEPTKKIPTECSISETKSELRSKQKSPALPPTYGQPTPTTHPHILRENELVQGVTKAEFIERRHRLMLSIQQYALLLNQSLHNHMVIVPSASKKYMSDKIPYVFRQNSDFYYLSGCLEPDTVLVMWIDELKTPKSALFIRPKDKHAELWDGARTGPQMAPSFFGVDEAQSVGELKSFLTKHINQHKSYTLWYDKVTSEQQQVTEAVQHGLSLTKSTQTDSPIVFIHRQRVIKSPAEAELMRTTCRIASESINRTMAETIPGDSEHHIFARVDYYCRMAGASFLAYPPVVAGGRNATTIHYINNSQIVNSNDLVLMDAGCEYGGYSSDITRTWPVSGTFTDPQRVLYEVLQEVQKELIDCLLNAGGRTLDELFDTMCLKLGQYLQKVHLIPKSVQGDQLIRMAYSFCPHHVSHYLGMDVHDTPLISRNTPILPGMVFTVEPGIYIAADRKDVPEEFRGIGLRIEDDIYVTPERKIEVLTEKCIKNSNDLEVLVKSEYI